MIQTEFIAPNSMETATINHLIENKIDDPIISIKAIDLLMETVKKEPIDSIRQYAPCVK